MCQFNVILTSETVSLRLEILAIAQGIVSGYLIGGLSRFAFVQQRKGVRIARDNDHPLRFLDKERLISHAPCLQHEHLPEEEKDCLLQELPGAHPGGPA